MNVQLLCSDKGLKSESLKRIAEELSGRLGYKVVRTTLVNDTAHQLRWGAPADKLEQYKWFKNHGVNGLEFTTDQAAAGAWFNSGQAVVGRALLSSYEGKGIVMFDPDTGKSPSKEEVLSCKVFTKFLKKDREFRVHMFKGKPVVILEKKKKKDWDGPSSKYIFNTENGYVFCQNDLVISQPLANTIYALSQDSSKVCKSDFQGIDIGYCSQTDNLFVIEVNSAPGIEGSNVNRYCDAIEKHLNSLKPAQKLAPTAAWPL